MAKILDADARDIDATSARLRAAHGAIASALLRAHTRDTILDAACRLAADVGGCPLAWAGLIEPGALHGRIVARAGPASGLVDALHFGTLPEAAEPAAQALRAGSTTLCAVDDPVLAGDAAALRAAGLAAVAALALQVEGDVAGVLVVGLGHAIDAAAVAELERIAADVSCALERAEQSERGDYLAYYDPLTTLPNATLFADRLSQLLRGAGGPTGVAVLRVDLADALAALEPAVTQRLLRLAATRLRDAVPDPCSVARTGAAEFALAGPCATQELASTLCDITFGVFARPFAVEERSVSVPVRIGVALAPVDGRDPTALLRCAAAALARAHADGLPTAYHSAQAQQHVLLRARVERQLRAALARDEFVLHYQPRVDLANGQVVGAEALLRWQDPDGGLVGPGQFIAVAEESGLIVPIGAWVLRTVCAQQAAWQRMGLDVVPIALNLSAVQVLGGDMLAQVQAALAATQLDARLLDLEVTETTLLRDPQRVGATLRELKQTGVRLALDDFGTGASSLAHLKRHPFQAVKIDRSFVAGITHQPEDAAVATAIISMAHSMGLKAVAEGIETEGQLRYLRGQGCDEMQGNYFCAPVPAATFESFLRSQRRLPPPPGAPEQRTLLVVDDEHGIRAALNRVLRREGYRILTAASGSEALDLMAVNTVQVIISDQRMPGMLGTEFLSTVKQLYPATVRLILSGQADLETINQAVNRGAVFRYLTKPWDDDQLREQVRDAFRYYRPEAA